MFDIKVDPAHAIIEFIVEGPVGADDVRIVEARLQEAKQKLPGRDLKLKADIRGREHAGPAVGQMVRALHAFASRSGVMRLAELVESDVVAAELSRAAKEMGTEKILRRFWEDESAHEWLLYGDLSPSSIGARWR